MTVVELSELTKSYAGGVEALRGVDLRIDEGEMVAIVGPSGSGKSTLLQLIGCLERPSSGEIRLRGRNISRDGDRRLSELRGRQIGFVFQQFHLVDALTAVENVALPLLYQSTRHAADGAERSPPSSGSASATGSTTGRPSCRAASGNGWRSPERSSPSRR